MSKRRKTFSQLRAEGAALIRQDAKERREQMTQSQLDLDRYTAQSIPSNAWGFPDYQKKR